MPGPEETARRKALKQAMREAEREAIQSTLPLTPEQIRRLFDFVDEQLAIVPCDDTLQNTLTFLGKEGLPVDPVVDWLGSAGGYCDCEILANAEEKFLFAFPEDNS
jgi:hypothetical protein